LSILDKIVKNKKDELPSLKEEFKKITPEMRPREIITLPTNKNFIITEIKLASPSSGEIIKKENIAQILDIYIKGKTDAVSIVVDRKYFKGDPCLIREVSSKINKPILFKEFIIDKWQINFAYSLGADIILLIAEILDSKTLKKFYQIAEKLGLSVIFEVHTYKDLEKVLHLNPKFIGINNRDLNTFTVDINRSILFSEVIPDEITKISESGINSSDEIKLLIEHGFNGFLIGTSLLKNKNPLLQLKEFTNVL